MTTATSPSPGKAQFIHVGTEADIDALRSTTFEDVNVCTQRKVPDNGGWFLVFVGKKSAKGGERYSGHKYIVRCRDLELRDEAMKIVRDAIGAKGGANG